MTHQLSEEGRKFLEKQLKLIKKGWYIYLPLAIGLDILAFMTRYTGDLLRHLIVAFFTMGVILIFAFLITPLRRLKIINHIVKHIQFSDKAIHLETCTAMWKTGLSVEIPVGDFDLLPHANKKGMDLFDLKPSFRLLQRSSGETFYLAGPYFENWQELFETLSSLQTTYHE